jgi:DNA invertase Pin-like site-specific DNA recombinase
LRRAHSRLRPDDPIRVHSLSLDTASPTGRLMLNVIGSVAQFEREVTLERQREGIAKAKREGRYKDERRLHGPSQPTFTGWPPMG